MRTKEKFSEFHLQSMFYILMLSSVFVLNAAAQSSGAPAATGPAAPSGNYVGVDTCGACHPDQYTQFKKTKMATLLTKRFEEHGCEACHGEGKAHAEAIGAASTPAETEKAKSLIYSFRLHSPKENANRCLVCHQRNDMQSLFTRSRHLMSGVACPDCHSPHRGESTGPGRTGTAMESTFSLPNRNSDRQWFNNTLLKDTQPKLCYTCHRDIERQFQLPVRHRVNEGFMVCTDCHNPHGTRTGNELRAATTEACTACHVEKRGPFVFEHAAMRIDGCIACHDPHGSVNQHLLKRRQNRQLCLECHTAPEGVNTPHARLGFQTTGECTRCHMDIHGSNYQRAFLR